jgi:hypothetical protein
VLLNIGNRIFSYPIIYLTEFEGTFLSVGNINNDEELDIIVGHTRSWRIRVYFNMGNGTFTNQTMFSIGFYPSDAKPVDINGDGKMEIIALGTNHDDVYIGNLWINC